ncbi:MAG TPA: heavy-metal-associated domain-containing protein [Caldilineae bacterium]|nr:heavy-metal-associated domain-containing protein [Caldilineae bacterium]
MRRAIAFIRQLPGIHEATGDLQTVTVTYDPGQVSVEEISQAIERAGYHVEEIISDRYSVPSP